MRWLFSLFACLIVSSRLQAAELVVNGRASNASDTNPGTAEKPLKTISAAAAKVRSGDHVLIHGGEYRETVIITASGSEKEPIVFSAAPGETPVIKGSDILAGWQRDEGSSWRTSLPPAGDPSSDSTNSSFSRTNDVRMVFIKDGRLLDARALRRVENKAELNAGTFYCEPKKNLLWVQLMDSTDPNALRIEATARGTWMQILGCHIVIKNLEMRQCGNSGAHTGPGCFVRGDNVRLENCYITWSDYVGVLLAGKADQLVHSVLACHGNSAIGGSGEDHLIDHCRILYNNFNRFDPSWHAGGAKLIPNFSRGKITHNEFASNVGPGLWLDSNCNDNLIEGNLCHHNEGAGILIEVSARNRLFNNVCYENRNLLSADFLAPDTEPGGQFKRVRRGQELQAQLLYHAGDGRGVQVSSSPETKVYHNTCYLNEGEGICVEGETRLAGETSMSSHGTAVLNNVCVSNKGTQLVFRQDMDENGTSSGTSDHNLIQTLGAVFAQVGWNSPFLRSLKEWQKTGFDQHSIQDDPYFAMATMGDFRLLPISPALRIAPALPEVEADFLGRSRHKPNVTLGAFEEPAFDYPQPAAAYLDEHL